MPRHRNQALNWIERARQDQRVQEAQQLAQRQARENKVYAARIAKHTAGGAAAATAGLAAKDFVTPQKASKGASGISPSDKKMPHFREEEYDDEEMKDAVDVVPDNSRAVSTRASMIPRGTSSGGNQETRISKQRPHYGLPETVTQVITNTTYFSIITPSDRQQMTRMQFRLNSLQDPIVTSFTTPGVGATYTAGVYNSIMPTGSTNTFPNPLRDFPSGSTDTSQWRAWFNAMYQYYSVLGIEWEITMYNPQYNRNCDIVVATAVDTYSAQSAINVHPSTATMREMEMWPDVRWDYVPSHNAAETGMCQRTIKGFYKTGMVKQNVENDEDVKTWTKTGYSPALTEIMNFYVGKAWINDITTATGLNCRLKLRMIVQFKDLNVPYRWPAAGQTPINLTAPTDILA